MKENPISHSSRRRQTCHGLYLDRKNVKREKAVKIIIIELEAKVSFTYSFSHSPYNGFIECLKTTFPNVRNCLIEYFQNLFSYSPLEVMI